MMFKNPIFRTLLLLALLSGTQAVHAAQDLQFWHSITGSAAAALEELVARFNTAQSRYQVRALYKEQDALQEFSEAKTQARPHLVLLDDSGTAALITAPGLVKPLWQVMAEAGTPLEASRLAPALAGRFLDRSGRLAAWPLASATPVLYSNKAMLREAGVDPDSLPRTWYEMPKVLGELYDKGLACPYTTAWPSWVQLENLSAWHNLPFATQANGLGGTDPKLAFNTQVMVRHVAMLASWAKARYFVYSGRRDEGDERFAKGECALLTSSSSSYDALRGAVAEIGVSSLPYYDDVADAPQNTLSKGSVLWVAAGKLPAEYRGVAEFLRFLASAPVQAEWHQKSGFLPLSREAYEITRKAGFYAGRDGREAAIGQVFDKAARENSRGIRLQRFAQIRDIIDQELEAAWLIKKMPKEALDDAVERGNQLLRGAPAGRKPSR